jgi:tRNA C32,U32 (ribose-2'-O)-methylase TrmJ
MGFDRLIIIGSHGKIDSKAKRGAAGAQNHLSKRIHYPDWESFYQNEGRGVRIGLSRRDGKLRQAQPLKEVLKSIDPHTDVSPNLPLYIILGPEDDGLNSEDLAFTNFCASLPTYGDFPSMNLSHAALLALYLVRDWVEQHSPEESSLEATSPQAFQFPDQTIREWLEAMGFSLEKRRASAYTTLRRVLLRNMPNDQELKVLKAILQQNIRKLKGE